jgi:BirA family biotin operon repressor/biotin-[acetyl-CoA-carboxylase] ligase
MDAQRRLAALLADGRFHSGRTLGRTLGVGRSAIWNQVQALQRAGLEVFAVRGRGYRLAEPLELLERARVLDWIAPERRGRLRELEMLFVVDSTNRYLSDRVRADAEPQVACLAEGQTAGRGRRGRSWISPLGRNLYLSLLWRLHAPPGGPGALSLAVGVAVAEALEALGASGVALKWPNDLLLDGAKLGGILIEIAGDPTGPWTAVIGVGVNLEMGPGAGRAIDQPWTDLARVLPDRPSRNRLAGLVLDRLVSTLDRYESRGFTVFHEAWCARDASRDRAVELDAGAAPMRGTARGVDREGALLVEIGSELHRVTSGEVTLRAGDAQ